MRVGPGVSDPDMGPIISKRQLETIERYVAIGKQEGATRRRRRRAGRRIPRSAGGYYFQPTLLDRVSPDMRVAQEEIFGPVLAIIDFDDIEEAATIANRSQYGLVAGIWTRDINKAMALASRIKSGQVYINTYGAGGGVELPFGGYKKSGYGREKGLESLASYTQVKNVCIKFARSRWTIGFIGLGNMGRPMASNLCRKGSSLVVYDVDARAGRARSRRWARRAAADVRRRGCRERHRLHDAARRRRSSSRWWRTGRRARAPGARAASSST